MTAPGRSPMIHHAIRELIPGKPRGALLPGRAAVFVGDDMDAPIPACGEECFHTNTQLFATLDEHNRFTGAEDMKPPYNVPRRRSTGSRRASLRCAGKHSSSSAARERSASM